MGVAKGIEQRLEGLVEGFFTRVFRSGLQPIEVGRRILREMADGKTVSVNKVYAPNEFEVLMGPDDYGRFSQMETGLQKEFGELVIEAAKDNRWNLMGLPRITFVSDEGFGKGAYRVEASFAGDPDQIVPVSTREASGDDPHPSGVMPAASAEKLGLKDGNPELLVLDADGKPAERISITRDPVVIGRMATNGVVLSDPNVSRRHAELRKDGEEWILLDLGSTNGTSVNGKLAKEHVLKDGDRLSFGTSELVFVGAKGA
ncbi:MAG: hypothetical protein QOH90_493 [Actinomycetota bacterium]|jgi:hypothetical protein|nr:hypothetical protein [Actinomycetota bacterium]